MSEDFAQSEGLRAQLVTSDLIVVTDQVPMAAVSRRIVIERETSEIAAIALLVGDVLEVAQRRLDSDCDRYMIVRRRDHDQLIYDDQGSIVEFGSGSSRPNYGD